MAKGTLGTTVLFFSLSETKCEGPRYKKPYAEKILISGENQFSPIHYHWHKMEDIINRGGGNLLIKVWKAAEDDGLSDEDVEVSIDGCIRTVKAGSVIRLTPGESITFLHICIMNSGRKKARARC